MDEQNFANHGRFVSLFHFYAVPMLIINFGIQVYWWIKLGFAPVHFFPVLVAAALFLGVLYGRLFALAARARATPLEESFRSDGALPADFRTRAREIPTRPTVPRPAGTDAAAPGAAGAGRAGKGSR